MSLNRREERELSALEDAETGMWDGPAGGLAQDAKLATQTTVMTRILVFIFSKN